MKPRSESSFSFFGVGLGSGVGVGTGAADGARGCRLPDWAWTSAITVTSAIQTSTSRVVNLFVIIEDPERGNGGPDCSTTNGNLNALLRRSDMFIASALATRPAPEEGHVKARTADSY